MAGCADGRRASPSPRCDGGREAGNPKTKGWAMGGSFDAGLGPGMAGRTRKTGEGAARGLAIGALDAGRLAIRLLAALMAALAALALVACSSSSISPSTVQREALDASAVTETAYYEDQAGWISDPAALEEGMRHFFEETGVQPYLAILPDGEIASSQEASQKASELYSQLFSDEGHFLFAICNDGEGKLYYGSHIGSDAEDVLDKEATNIFLEYLEQYNPDESISKEELFSSTFASTADRIMQTAVPPFFDVLVYIGVIVLAAAVVLIVRRLAKPDPTPQKGSKANRKQPAKPPAKKLPDGKAKGAKPKPGKAAAPEARKDEADGGGADGAEKAEPRDEGASGTGEEDPGSGDAEATEAKAGIADEAREEADGEAEPRK